MNIAKHLATAFIAVALATSATAQTRTIKVVVPYPAGGVADSLARVISAQLATALGSAVVVENKAGAAGALGATFVKNSEPDGNTLLFTNVGPSAIAPATSKTPQYDPSKDFVAVSLVSKSPLVLAVPAASPYKDIASLIAAAKAAPNAIEYSSAGVGSFGHLATELFAQSAGIQLLHVPYQGGAPATLAVLSGEVKMSLTAPSSQMFGMVQTGKVRILGVSSRGASSLVPGASPISEVVPGFESEYWFGFVAPARTSEAEVRKLHAAIDKILAEPATAKQLLAMGNEVNRVTSSDFQKLIDSEWARWRAVVKSAKVEMGS